MCRQPFSGGGPPAPRPSQDIVEPDRLTPTAPDLGMAPLKRSGNYVDLT
jgi:hypothetical protein